MVRTEFRDDGQAARIVLSQDGDWSWHNNAPLMVALLLASSVVAVVTIAMGAWMVPFFSLFELLMVMLAIYLCLRRGGVQEVLTFSRLELKYERGRFAPEETLEVERFYARFLVRTPASRLARPELKLLYRRDGVDRQLRIGTFLTTPDLVKVEKSIREILRRLD